ncbi:MAG: FMN-binding negative transcriptional regulator [Caulobacteraceae bacterium]|nr:FMN-binding negative transcriptional regulator [Caulobacteraceae bacterium]
MGADTAADAATTGHAPRDLLAAYPLAWVISAGRELHTTLLPLQIDGVGEVIRGHFARSNPHVEALRAQPEASVLVLGPHGYISPSWLSDRTQAPSWNYAAARFDVELRFVEDEAFTHALLRAQSAAHEGGGPAAWSPDEMGERFARLARGVVGFEARVLSTIPRYKLGQADRDDVFAECLRALAGDPLAGWMAAANPGRG